MRKLKVVAVFIVLVVIGVLGVYRTKYIKSESVSAQTPTYDWPQVQNNPQRTGYSPEVLGTNFSVAWTHPFQPEKVYPQVQAIVYQGKVFVGTEMGNLYGLNATNGTQAWKFTAGSPILASVAAGNGIVYFGALDGAVYAVNANTGAQVWKKQLSSYLGFSTSPVFADNKVMIGGQNGIFYALDPANGNVIWQYNAQAPIFQTAAYNNQKVFFGSMDMYVHAVNTTDGTRAWRSQKIPQMAFIFPSLYEGFGLSVLEAQSMGCPIISSDRGSLKEILPPSAVVIDPEKEQKISEAMEYMFALYESEKYFQMIKDGLEFSKQFSWEKTAQETLRVYQEVTSQES